MSLPSDQQFSIEIRRTSEELVIITVTLPNAGYQNSFEIPDFLTPVTRFDALAFRHGTEDETDPSVIRITDVEIVATLANIPQVNYSASVIPEGAGTIEGESEGTVPQGSTLDLETTATGDLLFDRFEAGENSYPDNPAQIDISSDTNITAYYVPAIVSGILSGLLPNENESRPWHSPWLGEIAVDTFPWVIFESGWMFLLIDEMYPNDDALWVYDSSLGWAFSGNTYFPFFYVQDAATWAFVIAGENAEGDSGRWVGFYNAQGEIGEDDWVWYWDEVVP